MMSTITQVNIEDLAGGKKFDRDELILIRLEDMMITIRQAEAEEIQYWRYDLNVNEDSVELRTRNYDRITPENKIFNLYRQKLMEAKLWQ